MRVILFTAASSMSGGVARIIEILRRAHGRIDFVPVFDEENFKGLIRNVKHARTLTRNYAVRLTRLRPIKLGTPFYTQRFYLAMDRVARRIADIAKEEKAELVVTPHETLGEIALASAAGRKARIPWTTVLNLTPVVQNLLVNRKASGTKDTLNIIIENERLRMYHLDFYGALRKLIVLKAITMFLRQTLVLSVSPSIERDMKLLNSNVQIRNLIPGNGVDFQEIDSVKEPFREEYDYVFYARLVPDKGLFDLPYILREVVKLKPGAKLGIAGIPSREDYILRFKQLIQKFELERNIFFLGYQSRKRLIQLIKSSRCVVYPTRTDAFPLGVLEALACGKPVVAHNIPAITLNYKTTAVEKIPLGNHQKFAETLVHLTIDNSEYKRRVGDALRFASKFTWEKVVEEEAKAYKAVARWSSDKHP